jgi:Flp pilus assembly pilin Flp
MERARRRSKGCPTIFWRRKVKDFMSKLWRDETGNDLVEYSLLLAFICLAGAAMFVGMGRNVNSMWGIVNSRLAANQPS